MRKDFRGTLFIIFLLLPGLAVILLLSSSAEAQLPTATISGTVKDPSGAVVPGAAIMATNAETGMTRSAQTGNDGAYRFPALSVGIYDVQVEQTGFQAKVQTGLRITVGQEAVMNFTLDVGAVTETVSVTAEAPIVNTTSGMLGSLVNKQTLADLPLNGRNYTDLALLQSGVNVNRLGGGRTDSGIQFSANGAPVRSNLFMMDGTIMNDARNSGGGSLSKNTLGIEGIQEFQVVTNAFSAEYGLNMGSQITMVTKSGTNQMHGSLFEYLRNSALEARNWTDIQKPPFRRNNYGGSVGGPIRHDRIFYFATYEGSRQVRSLSIISRVPTLAARTGDLNGDGTPEVVVAEVVKPYLQFWPAPNAVEPGRTDVGVGRFVWVQSPREAENYVQGRIDHTLSSSDTLFGRYTILRSWRAEPQMLPDLVNARYDTQNQWLTLANNHIFSPTLLANFRASFSRTHAWGSNVINLPKELSFIPGQGMGELGITNITDYSTVGPQTPFNLNQRLISFSDDMFYTRGRHALKFGALINFYRQYLDNAAGSAPRGEWQFDSVRDFLLARPVDFGAQTPGSITFRTYDYRTLGFYLQDDLRVTPSVTLNLGFRYEFNTQVTEKNGDGAALRDVTRDSATTPGIPFKNGSLRNLSPRVGFAWDVRGDGKMALRGGVAILYDVATLGTTLFIAVAGTPPLSSRTQMTPADGLVFGPFPRILPELAATELRLIDYNLEQPRLYSYNLTLDRQLPFGMGLSVAYAGSRGTNLMNLTDGNPTVPQGWVENGLCVTKSQPAPFTTEGPKCWTGSDPRPNPNFRYLEFRTASVNSWYNSLQVVLRKALGRGFQFQNSYTWSHSLDEGQGQGQDAGGGRTDPSNRHADKASSNFDQRHTWRAHATYRFPWELTGVWGALFSGWSTSGIVTANSGLPFEPTLNHQRSRMTAGAGGGRSRTDLRPGIKHEDITRGVSRGCLGVPEGTPLGTPTLFFDPCAFAVPALGFLGNAGRSIMYGPNFSGVDFSLVKDTRIPRLGESGSLQFRAEIFNILNHPSLRPPNSTVFNANRTTPGSYELAPLGAAGKITSTFGTSRQIQLSLRLAF